MITGSDVIPYRKESEIGKIFENLTYAKPEKRVELHLNSQMSGLDGCVNLEVLKSRLEEMGHTAVGVT